MTGLSSPHDRHSHSWPIQIHSFCSVKSPAYRFLKFYFHRDVIRKFQGWAKKTMEASAFNQPWRSRASFSKPSSSIFPRRTGKTITISQILVQLLMHVGLQLYYLWQMRLDIYILLFLWARILYMVHGTQLLLVSKCSAECPLAASKVSVIAIALRNWPMLFCERCGLAY